MERNGGEWANTYARLTWQAWDGPERLAGIPAPEDPIVRLERDYKALLERDRKMARVDGSDDTMGPLHLELVEAQHCIFRTPAASPAGIVFKLRLRAHTEAPPEGFDRNTAWRERPVEDFESFEGGLDFMPIISALHDAERLVGEARSIRQN